MRHNHPDGYIEAYGRDHFLDSDPCATELFATGASVLWNEVYTLDTLAPALPREIGRGFDMDIGVTACVTFGGAAGIAEPASPPGPSARRSSARSGTRVGANWSAVRRLRRPPAADHDRRHAAHPRASATSPPTLPADQRQGDRPSSGHAAQIRLQRHGAGPGAPASTT